MLSRSNFNMFFLLPKSINPLKVAPSPPPPLRPPQKKTGSKPRRLQEDFYFQNFISKYSCHAATLSVGSFIFPPSLAPGEQEYERPAQGTWVWGTLGF